MPKVSLRLCPVAVAAPRHRSDPHPYVSSQMPVSTQLAATIQCLFRSLSYRLKALVVRCYDPAKSLVVPTARLHELVSLQLQQSLCVLSICD